MIRTEAQGLLCRTMEQAFQDLRGLMGKAQEMVQLAQRFRWALLWFRRIL